VGRLVLDDAVLDERCVERWVLAQCDRRQLDQHVGVIVRKPGKYTLSASTDLRHCLALFCSLRLFSQCQSFGPIVLLIIESATANQDRAAVPFLWDDLREYTRVWCGIKTT